MGRTASKLHPSRREATAGPEAIADVAWQLADGTPPAWLVQGLSGCGAGIAVARHQDESLPTGTMLRKTLQEIEREIASVLLKLNDPAVLSCIERKGALVNLGHAVRTFTEIAARAGVEARNLPVGPGRKRPALRLDGIDATRMCALVSIEGWEMLRGKRPGSQETKALEAARSLWLATGGNEIGEEGSLRHWRSCFEEMADALPAHRELVRKLLRPGQA